MSSFPTDIFIEKIKSRSLKITVVGMGKMGIPISMVFSNAGFEVIGYDILDDVVKELNKGTTRIEKEPYVSKRLEKSLENGLFLATSDPKDAFMDSDVVIIIVPVLTDDFGKQFIDDLIETYAKISSHVKNKVVYIQESTVAPGTTNDIIKSELEKSGRISGVDFELVYSPERTSSGQVIADIEENYPKIIGPATKNAGIIVSELYNVVCKKGVISVSNPTTAEAVKTFKGAYRDANIALANQFAVMADLFEVDVIEVINAANTEPSSHIHRPGIGVGGHCIPVYPQFLISKSKTLGYDPEILISSRKANKYMVDYATSLITEKIENDDSILILGLSYRGDVKEHRNSPTMDLVPKIRSRGISVYVTDPLYSKMEVDNLFGDDCGKSWGISLINEFDNIIIATDHSEFKGLEEYLKNKFVYDGRYVINQEEAVNIDLYQPGRYLYRSEK